MSLSSASMLTSDPRVREAIDHCRRVTRTRAGNFYWGLRLTPEPRRSAMYAIYAWMRQADDIVDGTSSSESERGARVASFRRATERALTGTAEPGDRLFCALAAVASEFPLEKADFHSMIDGQLADLVPQRIKNWDELREYCCQVAGTVGSVCVRIWGYDRAEAIPLAFQRGIAFQLTNILRDVVEDVSMGRVYLPQELFDRFGITPAQLCAWSDPPRCDALMRSMITTAREHFESSRSLESMIDAPCRPTLRALTGIYEELLNKIARDPSQVVRKRVALPTIQKVIIALRARVGRDP